MHGLIVALWTNNHCHDSDENSVDDDNDDDDDDSEDEDEDDPMTPDRRQVKYC